MRNVEQQILAILEQRLSEPIARSVLRRSTSALGVSQDALRPQHVPALAHQIEKGIRLFVDPEHQGTLLERIRALAPNDVPPRTTIDIGSEQDVTRARGAAREVVSTLGASSFVVQKVVTAVSELARNIAAYAGSGQIEIVISPSSKTKIKVVAMDQGPGIADIELVLSGQYRSKTGLGRGILGVKRMADEFDIKTSSLGTIIRAEFSL